MGRRTSRGERPWPNDGRRMGQFEYVKEMVKYWMVFGEF